MTGGSIMRSSVLNLAGGVVPLAVGLFTIPALLERIGVDRFGLLSLVWVVIGYFSVFDLGLGRALTRLVAEKMAIGAGADLAPAFWTAMALMAVGGGLAAGATLAVLPWLVGDLLTVPAGLEVETYRAFAAIAAVIPLITTTTGLRGLLEAHNAFGLVNVVRLPLGVLTFLAPLVVALWSPDLLLIVAALIAARLIAWITYLAFCHRVAPELFRSVRVDRRVVRPLLVFGGWMTLSNTVGPIMLYLDRVMIGAFVSVTAVAYYATPYEMVTKLLVVPSALAGVLFPALTSSMARRDEAAPSMVGAGVGALYTGLWLPTVLLIALASEIIELWLGGEFARHSASILQWLAAGVFVNSLAHVPFYLLQAAGRPDLPAKIHLVELPLYVGALVFALYQAGVVGAAVVWTGRACLDGLIFFVAAWRLDRRLAGFVRRLAFGVGAAAAAAALAAAAVGWSPAARLAALFAATVVPLVIGWLYLLTGTQREALLIAARRWAKVNV